MIVNHNLPREPILIERRNYFQTSLSTDALGTCVNRICLSLKWIKGMPGGNSYYVPHKDLAILSTD